MSDVLLSRTAFREAVLARAHGRCVVCAQAHGPQGWDCAPPAADAHHIMERRLWPDGGYYLRNGAAVCEEHHLACERTDLSVEEVAEAAGITHVMLPPHLYRDLVYDKWGNVILRNVQRLRGELFYDESVQRILAGKLHLFTDAVKYPRTHHLPWSPGITEDDRVMGSLAAFEGRRVIVTRKMDGENTSLYRDRYHARSVDSGPHPSRDYVKGIWGRIRGDIPDGWRVCGENLYARHSIAYRNLPSYLLAFSIWDERNGCLAWDDTLEWFALLGLEPVPVLYDGPYDEVLIRGLWTPDQWDTSEGYVVRTADGFPYGAFRAHVGKFVRPGHVQTSKHWLAGQAIEPNGLAPAARP